jgi:hypothetical protein
MSVSRTFAQRNNNSTELLPTRYADNLSALNIQNAAIYTLNITKAQFVKGIYSVDLSGVDTSGNALNYDGSFASFQELSGNTIPIICFAINIDTVPSAYPGMEFTIFFKNLPPDIGFPLFTIGILSSSYFIEEGIPLPYIVSPPFPPFAGAGASPSITLKSDGNNFNVVSSGPAGWLGVPALAVILNAYQEIGL